MPLIPSLSLKLRLGLGAALLGAGTLLAAAVLYTGMTRVADRLDAALAAEARMNRYAALSRQVSGFLVVATEAAQSGMSADTRADRLAPVADQLRRTFSDLDRDLERGGDPGPRRWGSTSNRATPPSRWASRGCARCSTTR